MSNEKVGDAICRMSREGKSYEEIFWEVLNNTPDISSKRQKQNLADGIAQILNRNVFAIGQIPDEPA